MRCLQSSDCVRNLFITLILLNTPTWFGKLGPKKRKKESGGWITHPTGFSPNNFFFFNTEASANDWYFLDYKLVFHFCHVVHTNQYHFFLSIFFFLPLIYHIPSTIYRLVKTTWHFWMTCNKLSITYWLAKTPHICMSSNISMIKKKIETHPSVHPFVHLLSQVIVTPSKSAKMDINFDVSLALLIYDIL